MTKRSLFAFSRNASILLTLVFGVVLAGALIVSAAIVSGAVTTGSSANVTITQLTLGKPASTTAGDVMIAAIANKGGTNATVTPPAGWNLIARTDNGTSVGLLTYWRTVESSEPSSYTWVITPTENAQGGIVAYSGVDTDSPIDVSGGATGHGNSAVAPSITTNEENDEIIAVFAEPASGISFGQPTGMTEKYDAFRSGTGPALSHNDAVQASAGASGAKTATIGGAQQRDWAAQQIALKEPPAPITFDVSEQTNGTNPSLSITRGTGAMDYVGLVELACISGNTASSVTWGGNAMTQVMEEFGPDGNAIYWYYVVNLASGTQTVAASTTGNCQLGALTYSGVNQGAPLDTNFDGASNSYVRTPNTAVSANSELTTTGTTHIDRSLAVLTFDWQTGVAPGSNATERLVNAVYDRGTPTSPAGSVSIGVLNDTGAEQSMAGFMIALQPSN